MNKIRILQIVPSLSLSNGVAAYLMNYYEKMNLEPFETTILVLNEDNKGRYDSFERLGCKIVELYKTESWSRYLKRINNFFKENEFDIVHCHAPNYGAFYMHYAKKNGVKTRILHSHAKIYAETFIRSIRNIPLAKIAVKNSNQYMSCSKEAGEFLFGNKPYTIINNAIDLSKFKYNEQMRQSIREQLALNDCFVLGEFGRFTPVKNQLFSIEVLKCVLEKINNAKLLLIGEGEQEKEIQSKINEFGIQDKVIILNGKSNINEYYNCLDAFLLPSLGEGLGMVLIEAQANSLNCYASKERVPELSKVSPLLKYLELEKGPC
jgi:glycosyltransferase involved in cell wall biosynthesis